MIYLSICIPTYNRIYYLVDTINSIINQPEFIESNEVEIVVSDNCSTDDTEIVMRQFLTKHPTKIKYSRNSQNIIDGNYEKVLSLGSGKMLKLNNDTLILNPGCLSRLLESVKSSINNDVIPFFLNGEDPKAKKILCEDAASFISAVSFRCTWIGGFCIPKRVFETIQNFSKTANLRLVQVDILMQMLKAGNHILILPEQFSTSINPVKKGGYNLPEVFLTNYFKILSEYLVDKNEIKALKKEKKKMLFKFILPWLITLYQVSMKKADNYLFETADYDAIIKKEFSNQIYYIFKIQLIFKKCKTKLKFLSIKLFETFRLF